MMKKDPLTQVHDDRTTGNGLKLKEEKRIDLD